MAFSVNTNIASLQAQEYLRITTEFQTKTINRVTSGLRIVSSGDDAAGLAIANGFRSDRSVLVQGVRNANDGLSTLQTIDGGINNISQLLDRARTLAAQSASGTFNGDRTVLDSEFSSVIEEIDRQAQAIGLNTGGIFARTLAVFIGGGRGSNSAEMISNGSVSVDLSTSTVDTHSLGLKGFQSVGVAGTDIGNGNTTTKVSAILDNTTNTTSTENAGFTEFFFRGAGFSDSNRIRVSVSLGGVADTTTLVEAINGAIEAAENAGTQYATSFKEAGIRASVITDSDGSQRLAFTSSTHAFQVAGGDRVANAFLGKFETATNTGAAVDYSVSSAAAVTGTDTFASTGNVMIRLQGSSLASPVELALPVTGGTTTVNDFLTSLTSLVTNSAELQAAGIKLETAQTGSPLKFTSTRGETFEVQIAGDTGNALKMGSFQSSGASFDYTSITGAGGAFNVAGTTYLRFSVGGAAAQQIAITTTTASTIDSVLADINTTIANNASLSAAGLYATKTGGGQLIIASQIGSFFRLSYGTGVGTNLGFGTTAGVTSTTSSSGGLLTATSASTAISGGAYSSGSLSFSAIRNGNDDQTITLTTTDANGAVHTKAIGISSDTALRNARSIDEAIAYINQQIQATNDRTLQRIVAVKEYDTATDTEKIVFLNPMSSFKVSVGANATGASGVTTSQGTVISSTELEGGATADISTKENAEAAVSALAEAVSKLGKSQATVGKGQNAFNFAISLAQTQLINLAASESRIRDADLAAEAANLTKAQILQQAGIAALGQANSAPQAVLSLLQG